MQSPQALFSWEFPPPVDRAILGRVIRPVHLAQGMRVALLSVRQFPNWEKSCQYVGVTRSIVKPRNEGKYKSSWHVRNACLDLLFWKYRVNLLDNRRRGLQVAPFLLLYSCPQRTSQLQADGISRGSRHVWGEDHRLVKWCTSRRDEILGAVQEL